MEKKQNIKKFIIYLSILATLTSGCTKNKNNSSNTQNIQTQYYPKYEYYTNSGNDPILRKDTYQYSNNYINIDENNYSEFVKFLNNLDVTYQYEKYYGLDNALAKYNEIKDKSTSVHSNVLSEFSADELFSSVKINNKKYLEEKDKEYVSAFYDEFDDEQIKYFCEIIIDTINHYKEFITDENEVKCILGNLKIFSKPTMSNSSVTDDDCLLINLNMINTLKIKAKSKDQDVLKDTISHEAVHLLQKSCKDNLNNMYRIGNSYKFDDLKVNSLFYNWFYEGSAEKLSNGYTGDTPLVYEYYINYINSLNLSTLLDVDNDVNQAEKTTFDKNLKSLFSMFDCSTEQEKREILNMMFSLNIIESDDQGFLTAMGISSESDKYIGIKRNIKTSVCMTLTKYFYKNLANNVKNNNMKLQDVFYLITVFECDLNYHLTYTDLNKYTDNKKFINDYMNIQNEFFNMIAASNGYTLDELKVIYDNYGIYTAGGKENYSLVFLDGDKCDFIKQILENTYTNVTEQIMDVYGSFGKVKTKHK